MLSIGDKKASPALPVSPVESCYDDADFEFMFSVGFAKLRLSMRVEIARLHRRLGAIMIYVTHDQIEAMTLGQRIVLLRDGEIRQVDTPMTL